MGIRCYCPNQHRLNLKGFLAGKRCVCPECGIKFIVPLESESADPTGQSRAASGAAAVATQAGGVFGDDLETSVLVDEIALPPAAVGSVKLPFVPPPPSATANDSPNDLAMWYVRGASGEQFGPVPVAVFRTWLNEGRVPSDALVWREGWPEWRQATVVIATMRRPAPPPAPAPTRPPASQPHAMPASVSAPTPVPAPVSVATGEADARLVPDEDAPPLDLELAGTVPHKSPTRRRKDRRKERNVAVVTMLLVALAVLIPVLIWVVMRG